jgi:homoserine trans-succinylase
MSGQTSTSDGAPRRALHHYGIGKQPAPSRCSAVHHKVLEPLERSCAVSTILPGRSTRSHGGAGKEDVRRAAGLKIMASSDKAACTCASTDGRLIFVFGHPE